MKRVLMYAFYFSKTIYNTSKIANKKVLSTSLESWGAVASSPRHPAASIGYSSDSSLSIVTTLLSNGGGSYECVLPVAACNLLLRSIHNIYSLPESDPIYHRQKCPHSLLVRWPLDLFLCIELLCVYTVLRVFYILMNCSVVVVYRLLCAACSSSS